MWPHDFVFWPQSLHSTSYHPVLSVPSPDSIKRSTAKAIVMEWAKDGAFNNTNRVFPPLTKTLVWNSTHTCTFPDYPSISEGQVMSEMMQCNKHFVELGLY